MGSSSPTAGRDKRVHSLVKSISLKMNVLMELQISIAYDDFAVYHVSL